jgi:hypothetical protein
VEAPPTFSRNGNIELTNNRVEHELRKLVLGRRNWLFVWEDLGGERTAQILTIVGTCVAQANINAAAFLPRQRAVLTAVLARADRGIEGQFAVHAAADCPASGRRNKSEGTKPNLLGEGHGFLAKEKRRA